MQSSNPSSQEPSNKAQESPSSQFQQRLPRLLPGAFLVLSLLGFLDSLYLAVTHYAASPVPCSLVHGCEVVLQSTYSEFFGIPVALFGVFYYLGVFLLVVAFLDTSRVLFLKAVAVFPVIGFLFTLWFLFVQAVLLKAFCLYCLASAGFTTILFALSLLLIIRYKIFSQS